jgi:hypothetical protein
MTTRCSFMLCKNDAEVTNDPAHPPFCKECQEKARKERMRNARA